MNIESLENRLLLATGPMLYTSFDGVSKKLTVSTAPLGISNNAIVISVSGGGTLSVSVGGVNDYNDTFANILSISVDAGSGNDSINLGTTTTPITVPTTLNGGNGNDTITGGAGPDQIFGGAGNDSMDGGLGADSISGGADNDTVSYATRATAVTVTLTGSAVANDGATGELDNVGFGTSDVESVMGGSGNDFLTGSAVGNYISGGAGNDSILGGDGSDTVVGGAGNDTLKTEAGPDFIFARDGEYDLIDGGADIDSADVDTSPVEAPLPGAPVAGSPVSAEAVEAPVNTEIVGSGPKAVSPFSTRRVPRRPLTRTRARARALAAAAASATPAPAPLPAPPPGDYEKPLDPALLQSVLQPLDPYCKGQALVIRDAQGSVHVAGTDTNDPFTNGNDQFLVQTAPGLAGVNVTNNGGFTEWPLPSPTIFVNGQGGNDSLAVSGGNVSYVPGNQPGSGTIISDGHAIIFNGINPDQILFTGVGNLTVVTPGAADFLHLGEVGTTSSTELDGQSGGIFLGTIVMDNVQLLTLDCGTNDTANSANDLLVVDNIPGGGPHLALMPGSFGADTVTVNKPGLVLVNDPTSTPGQPTVTLNINPNGSVSLANANTRLANLNLAGHLTLLPGGDKTLHPGGVNILGGTLDINDNSVMLDNAGSSFQQSGGTTHLGGGTLIAPQINLQGGLLAGSGTITGDLFNAAIVSPDAITINGNYTQAQTGTLVMQIGGPTPGTEFDQLSVGGTATLDGTLAVSLINGYLPASGDKFALIPYVTHQGGFATTTGLSFQGGVFVPQANPLKYLLDVNLAPVATPDSAGTFEDKPVNIGVLGNDSDPDDTDNNPDVDPPTIDTFTQAGHGTVSSIPGGGFTYVPAANFNGSDTFTYTLRDAANNTATAQVTITVKPVNDAPAFSIPNAAPAVNENSGAQAVPGFASKIVAGPPTATDEANQTLQFIVTADDTSLFSVQPAIDPVTGHLTYTPAADAHGSTKVDITLMDNGGVLNGGADTSATLSFTITINPVPPTVLGALFVREAASNPFPGNYLRVRFSESVQQSLSLADILVRNVSLNTNLNPTSLQYLPASQTAIITLPAGTLAEGNYTLTLKSTGITDPGGTPLDGDGDGQAGGDFVLPFFQLNGDVNLDRSVDFADLVAVAQHYNAAGTTFADGDLNGDGTVDFADLVAVAQNYGRQLVPPPGVPAALP